MAREDIDFLLGDEPSGVSAVDAAKAQLDSSISEVGVQESEMLQAMSPKGQFSKRVLGTLANSLNRVAPLFERPDLKIEKVEAPPEDANSFPEDYMRVLAMVVAASSDAAQEGVVESNLVPALETIVDDTGVNLLVGKLSMLAKDKDFKRFLKEPAPQAPEVEPVVEEQEPVQDEMSDEELFASRM